MANLRNYIANEFTSAVAGAHTYFREIKEENTDKQRLVKGSLVRKCFTADEIAVVSNKPQNKFIKLWHGLKNVVFAGLRRVNNSESEGSGVSPPNEDVGRLEFVKVSDVAGCKSRYELILPEGHDVELNPEAFFSFIKPKMEDIIKTHLKRWNGIKYHCRLSGKFDIPYKESANEERGFGTKRARDIIDESEIDDELKSGGEDMIEQFESMTFRGSGFRLTRCTRAELSVLKYQPLRGKSYIPLPRKISNTRAVLNIQNKDDRCHEWSILAGLHPTDKHAYRTSKYKEYIGELDYTGIEFPVSIKDNNKFEKQNKDIAINIFGLDIIRDSDGNFKDCSIYPRRISKYNNTRPHVIDLLLFNNEYLMDKESSDEDIILHYALIKDLSRLVSGQNSRHNGKTYCCRNCLHIFSGDGAEARLQRHLAECLKISPDALRVIMPTKKQEICEFRGKKKCMPAPYIIFLDFETLCKPNEDPKRPEVMCDLPLCSFGYLIVRWDGKPVHMKHYRGKDAIDVLFDCLAEDRKWINKSFKNPKPIIMTNEDERAFDDATECYICTKPLKRHRETGRLLKVRDHCHMSGKYRGAAHKVCNLKLRINVKEPWKNKIYVIAHNLRGFDGHLIMQAAGRIDIGKMSCIPNNMEKYMSFTMGQFVFEDSFQHLPASLASLAAGLQKDELKITRKYFKDDKQFELMTKKGVYPYDYMDSWDKFDETELPAKKVFYNKLTKTGIKDEEYDHAKEVWKEFKVKNMGTYHDLYLQSDVLLLADIWMVYRDKSLKDYGLEPTRYITMPGMSMDAMLRMTKAAPRRLLDYDMFTFCELAKRGGICSIGSKRYAKANNPRCPDYDKTKPNTWIIYLDANNLYPNILLGLLPCGDFEWVDLDIEQLLNTPDDSDIDYFVECDLEIPRELHDYFSDYPLAPECKVIQKDQLSDYQRKLLGDKKFGKAKKLILDLSDKEKYIVHGKLLRFYVKLGARITKIHRAIQFQQEAWMNSYITFNTGKRKNATSDFERDFYKLANNAVGGKTMENVRKHQRVDLVRSRTEKDRFRKLVADPAFIKDKEFDDGLFAIHRQKTQVTLNKPIQVGVAMLDLSKLHMYDFYYNHIKARYGDKVEVLYTDTDSFVLHIETEDIYEDMWQDRHLYDTSNFSEEFTTSKGHQIYSTENQKVPGKFKDECGKKVR